VAFGTVKKIKKQPSKRREEEENPPITQVNPQRLTIKEAAGWRNAP